MMFSPNLARPNLCKTFLVDSKSYTTSFPGNTNVRYITEKRKIYTKKQGHLIFYVNKTNYPICAILSDVV